MARQFFFFAGNKTLLQNIAVSTVMLPLPFVSDGGTGLVSSLAAVGMLVGLQVKVRQEFPLSVPAER